MLVYLGCVCFHAQFHTSMRVPVFLDFFCFYHQLVCLNMPVLESLWLYKAAENMCVCVHVFAEHWPADICDNGSQMSDMSV